MRRIENHCVDCALPCIGDRCSYRNVPVCYCDVCEDPNGEYTIEGKDYCESCAEEYLQGEFDKLTLRQKAELLDVELCRIDWEG